MNLHQCYSFSVQVGMLQLVEVLWIFCLALVFIQRNLDYLFFYEFIHVLPNIALSLTQLSALLDPIYVYYFLRRTIKSHGFAVADTHGVMHLLRCPSLLCFSIRWTDGLQTVMTANKCSKAAPRSGGGKAPRDVYDRSVTFATWPGYHCSYHMVSQDPSCLSIFEVFHQHIRQLRIRPGG